MAMIWIAINQKKKTVAQTSFPNLKKMLRKRAERTGKPEDKDWKVFCIDQKMTLKRVVNLINKPAKQEIVLQEYELSVADNGRCKAQLIRGTTKNGKKDE